MKNISKLTVLTLIVLAISACNQNQKPGITIGIIEPLEHTAMTEIVNGYTQQLKSLTSLPITIKVANAQNDMNLQRAIIQKMIDANYTMIVPIGVAATQMTLAMVHDKPVISLASDLSQQDRKRLQPCHVAVVHDEISSRTLMHFIHQVYPTLTQLTLIHSSADKVFPEVKQAIADAKAEGINLHPIMVSSLPELYTAANALKENTQGIFVLKDSLIVSGISTLAKIAADKHIPLITSDQGSVQDGAGFALGVEEAQIGIEGATLTAAVVRGDAICTLPIVEMKTLTVFANKKSLANEKQNLPPIIRAADEHHYKFSLIKG